MRSIDEFRGPRDESVLDPSTMVYRVEPARSKKAGSDAACEGCAFQGQWARTCHAAAQRAVAGGLPDCDDGFIYVLPDPRQKDCAIESSCREPTGAIY
jgi:hypothetical protein